MLFFSLKRKGQNWGRRNDQKYLTLMHGFLTWPPDCNEMHFKIRISTAENVPLGKLEHSSQLSDHKWKFNWHQPVFLECILLYFNQIKQLNTSIDSSWNVRSKIFWLRSDQSDGSAAKWRKASRRRRGRCHSRWFSWVCGRTLHPIKTQSKAKV